MWLHVSVYHICSWKVQGQRRHQHLGSGKYEKALHKVVTLFCHIRPCTRRRYQPYNSWFHLILLSRFRFNIKLSAISWGCHGWSHSCLHSISSHQLLSIMHWYRCNTHTFRLDPRCCGSTCSFELMKMSHLSLYPIHRIEIINEHEQLPPSASTDTLGDTVHPSNMDVRKKVYVCSYKQCVN